MTSFLHDRVRQLLFVDEMPSASTTSVENADRWIDPNTQLFRIDALYDAAQHDFNAVGDESFQFYIDYARFVQRLSKQCQLSSATAAPAAPVPMIDRLCSLLTVTATLDNVCRSLYCVRYRVRVAPKKLREVLARFLSACEHRAMYLLFRLLHHTCGALNSINFRNVIWHGFASAHEIDRLGAFAALLDALLLNLRHFGAIWIARDSIPPPIHEPLAPFVHCGARDDGAALSAAEFHALVRQAPLVHRASEQDRVYDGLFQLFRRGQRRDFAAVLFTTLEASLRVHYVRANAAAFGAEMIEFQLDYDALFISFAMLLNDTLFAKEAAEDGAGDYAYRFGGADRNLLLERVPGDVVASLRELVFELEVRDRLAHGLLQSDADISDDCMQAQWALLMALLECRFEPLAADERVARRHVPSFGVKRALALALQQLECAESESPFEAYYRALNTDALFVHECHGQLARICKNMCDARLCTDAAVASADVSADGATPKHLAHFRDAVHGVVYARTAQLVRRWLSECETSRGAVASVRLARVEILSAQLLDSARRAMWARFNLLAYHSGLLVHTQREHDLFGAIGRASVLRRDDERLVGLIKQED